MSKGMIEKSHEIARLYSVPVGRVTFKGWRHDRREGFYVDMPGEMIFAATKDGPIIPPASPTIVVTLRMRPDGMIDADWTMATPTPVGGFIVLEGSTLIDQIMRPLSAEMRESIISAAIRLKVAP